jgi:Cu(I)/Ag(I) efflux system periplasmic protein CusF
MIPRIAAAWSAFAQALTEGEVRKVNPATGKITLKHGEIRNLDMPPMTMVFTASDKALLKDLKAGDKVRFAAGKDAAGDYVVTAIERVR